MQKVVALVIISILVLSFQSAAIAQDGLSPEKIEEISQSVVQVVALDRGEPFATGSGTIVSANGIIFTNRHVVEGADDILIMMLDDINELPQPRYMARVVSVYDQMDFAVLQIDRDADGSALMIPTLNLPYIEPSVHSTTRGERIFIFGYPSIGNGYLVMTEGSITTIQNGDIGGVRMPVWYQTDAEISPGNSGGLVVNGDGELLGIPTTVASEERTGGRLGGILPFEAVLALAESGGATAGGGTGDSGGSGQTPPTQPPSQPPQQLTGSYNISCDSGFTITNGTEVTVVQMRSGFSYTATAIGVGGFDPVLAVIYEDGSGWCNDDDDDAAAYQVTLPSTGTVVGTSTNSRITFSHNSGAFQDIRLVVGGYGGQGGEVILILDGMAVTAADNAGDPFSVLLTDEMVAGPSRLNVYMIARDQSLDSYMQTVGDSQGGPLYDSDGAPIYCDDAGNAQLCWGPSDPLSAASIITSSGATIRGRSTDSMLSISPQGARDSDFNELLFLMNSYQGQSYGNYIIAFHLSLAATND